MGSNSIYRRLYLLFFIILSPFHKWYGKQIARWKWTRRLAHRDEGWRQRDSATGSHEAFFESGATWEVNFPRRIFISSASKKHKQSRQSTWKNLFNCFSTTLDEVVLEFMKPRASNVVFTSLAFIPPSQQECGMFTQKKLVWRFSRHYKDFLTVSGTTRTSLVPTPEDVLVSYLSATLSTSMAS